MEVWIYIIKFAVIGLAASAQNCPSDHFSAIFAVNADETIEFPSIVDYDFELSFLKNIVKLRDDAIQHMFADAVIFFNDTLGIDFSGLTPNEHNELFVENAIMRPFIFSVDFYVTANNWIQIGSTHSTCYQMTGGGFEVAFSDDQILYGSYGGTEGKPAAVNNLFLYGVFSVAVCKQSPLLIQFQSNTPIRSEPIDGNFVLNFDLYNAIIGYGKAQGIASINPDPYELDKHHAVLQIVFTFSAQTSAGPWIQGSKSN